MLYTSRKYPKAERLAFDKMTDSELSNHQYINFSAHRRVPWGVGGGVASHCPSPPICFKCVRDRGAFLVILYR